MIATIVYFTASLPSCGVQYDYKESDLVQKGYVKCYEQPYSHATSSANLAACSGSEYVFVGAKTSKSASSFAIGAFGVTSNVFKTTCEHNKAALRCRRCVLVPAFGMELWVCILLNGEPEQL